MKINMGNIYWSNAGYLRAYVKYGDGSFQHEDFYRNRAFEHYLGYGDSALYLRVHHYATLVVI